MFGFVSQARAVKCRVQALVQLNLELAKPPKPTLATEEAERTVGTLQSHV
jgi:hypothetical protein